MDILTLAALPPETPVIDALRLMHTRKQLGVICVWPNGNLFLAKAEDIGRALGTNVSTLGEVDGLVPVPRKQRKRHLPSLDFTVGFVRGFNTPSDDIESDYVLDIALEGDPSRPNCSCNHGYHDFELYIGMTCPKHGCPVT